MLSEAYSSITTVIVWSLVGPNMLLNGHTTWQIEHASFHEPDLPCSSADSESENMEVARMPLGLTQLQFLYLCSQMKFDWHRSFF